ncbi:hypothetical protein AC249_AIPGENE11850 [Exaiptasia diaphana]|nr:hypothetical protein AC249_AIPGENE11850 [Exaiptasia diaphana]
MSVGNRSNAVRSYKRTSREQELNVSGILYGYDAKKLKENEHQDQKQHQEKLALDEKPPKEMEGEKEKTH